jgi:uncharacterized protein (DUF1330 family)
VSALEPTPEQFTALADRPAGSPVVMVNLLRFRTPGGRERYLRYSQAVAPQLERVRATVLYAGTAPAVVIGDGQQPWWDAIVIVEYPTPSAFIDMVSSEDYAKIDEHRLAALERGELIATSVWSVAD